MTDLTPKITREHAWEIKRDAEERLLLPDPQVIASLCRAYLDLLDEREKLGAENYQDLADQMDEAWGYAPGRRLNVQWPELHAFLCSRSTHRPTESLRARIAHLEKCNAAFKEEEEMRVAYETKLVRVVEAVPKPKHLRGYAEWMLKRMDLDNNAHAMTQRMIEKQAEDLEAALRDLEE